MASAPLVRPLMGATAVPGAVSGAEDDRLGDRATHARRRLALLEALRKARSVAELADRDHGDGGEPRRQVGELADGLGVETAHLVHEETLVVGLHREVRHGLAEVVDGVTDGLAVFGLGLGDRDDQSRGLRGPELVELDQGVDDLVEQSGAAPSDDEAPRLQIVGGCLLYTSPSPRDQRGSRMPSSA